MVSRPTTVCISHAEALQQARDLAMQWLYPADEPMTIVQGRSSKSISPFVTYQQGCCKLVWELYVTPTYTSCLLWSMPINHL